MIDLPPLPHTVFSHVVVKACVGWEGSIFVHSIDEFSYTFEGRGGRGSKLVGLGKITDFRFFAHVAFCSPCTYGEYGVMNGALISFLPDR